MSPIDTGAEGDAKKRARRNAFITSFAVYLAPIHTGHSMGPIGLIILLILGSGIGSNWELLILYSTIAVTAQSVAAVVLYFLYRWSSRWGILIALALVPAFVWVMNWLPVLYWNVLDLYSA